VADEGRRAAMLSEQRNREFREQMLEEERKARENAMDQMMRRGDMQDLHREHLRRMQAKANKAAK
jgi:ribosomal protein S21